MSDTTAKLTPFIRVFLYVVSGALINRGLIDDETAMLIRDEPLLVEAITGGVMLAGGLVWYLWSKSRKALIEAVK